MPLQQTPYTHLLGAEAAVLLALAAYLGRFWLEERNALAGTGALITVSGAVWVSGYTLSLSSTTVAGKVTWQLVEFVGLATVPTLWLIFVLRYTRRDGWLSRRTYLAAGLPPAAFLALALTNPLHGLVVNDVTLRRVGSFVVADPRFGPAYWAFIAYVYLQIAAVVALLVYSIVDSKGFYRVQSGVLLVFSSMVPVAGIVAIVGFDPVPGLDITVVSVIAIGVPTVMTAYDDRFVSVTPIAGSVVVEEIEDAVIVIDRRDRLIDLNPAAERLTGFERDDAIGAPVVELLPEGIDRVPGHADAGEVNEEISVDDGGRTRHFDVRVTPFSGGGRVAILREITELRERERALERRNERLDQFASVVAHDLRNPLNVSMGSVEGARGANDPDEHLDRIERANGRMERIIDDLLELARRGRGIDAAESVELRQVVETAWDQAGRGTGSIRVEGDPVVEADPGRLEQLFENLFRNAIEHAGGDATVRVGPTDGGFYVEDDGPGIPPEDRDRIFEYGYTGGGSGTGIGLAIVRDVAESHGWSVTATEGEGGGARFEVAGVGGDGRR